MDMEWKTGMMVKSLRGRDEGFFVVVGVKDGSVWIADGRRRKVERPKRKNPKHLQQTATVFDENEIKTNNGLKRLLRPYEERRHNETGGNELV